MIIKAMRDTTAYAACHQSGVAPFRTGFEPGFVCGNPIGKANRGTKGYPKDNH
jgi:hypothetical protein